MYKYKQTTDVEIGDLVIWTESENPFGLLTKNKVYQVTKRVDQDTVYVINDMGAEHWYCKALGFKVLQTKPASEAVVGDYMYRISTGNTKFPQYSSIKITKIDNESNISNLYYASTSSVLFNEVIVIAQAEPEVKYPYFTESKQLGKEYICKVLDENSYTYVLNWGYYKNYSKIFYSQYPPSQAPCDFTTEPEVFDIDWWQQRFEAGLPVYYVGNNGYCTICHLPPIEWEPNTTFSITDNSPTQKVPMSKEDIELFKQQVPLSSLHLGLCQEISLGAAADCSLPYPIIQKEKPMKFQDFINSLFTEEIKTDYEKKPNFLVTIYNSEGTEIAVTTATSVKSVEDILQSSPKLWGSKAVMYSIDSEVQVSVPVVTTKFKKPKEEK